ncbi:unnamed protein product [Camellia sinensis]
MTEDSELDIIDSVGAEAGHVIRTTIGGRNGQSKQIVSYIAEHVVGTGSFGVVYQAKCRETGEIVAIKKVLQDKHYKNRELQIMKMMDHPNICRALAYIHNCIGICHRDIKPQNLLVCRALAYIHNCIGICHRDIKPQNLLVKGEPNVSYICLRYYRAPELIFGSSSDMRVFCIIDMHVTEQLLIQPLFPGESAVDQLVEIIKVLGTPTREEIKCMNPNYTEFKFPQIKPHPWHKSKMSSKNVCLHKLWTWFLEACIHPFFDELRDPNTRLPNGRPLPPLFNFKPQV